MVNIGPKRKCISQRGSWWTWVRKSVMHFADGCVSEHPGWYLLLCFTTERKSYEFGTTGRWVNDDKVKWAIPLMHSQNVHPTHLQSMLLSLTNIVFDWNGSTSQRTPQEHEYNTCLLTFYGLHHLTLLCFCWCVSRHTDRARPTAVS